MKSHKSGPTWPQERRDRLVQPSEHDTYRARKKLQGAVVCEDCGLVEWEGRWQRAAPIAEREPGLCPACRRVRERYPAGEVRLSGEWSRDRDEILAMVHRIEAAEESEHPLERLMEVKEEAGDLRITTTGMHLARRIAGALDRRWPQDLTINYDEEGSLVRVRLDRA